VKGGGVIPAGQKRIRRRKALRLSTENGVAAGPRVLDEEQSRLEEVAPEQVGVAVVVHVRKGEGVGPVKRRPLLARPPDNLNALKLVRHVGELGHAVRPVDRLVAGDGPVEPPQKEIQPAVAAKVRDVRDVLTVREDGLPLHGPQRVGVQLKRRRRGRADVPVGAEMAVRLFREQIGHPVLVKIRKPVPFADLQVPVVVRTPHEARRVPLGDVLEKRELAGTLLDKEIRVLVPVNVHKLRGAAR
jgi:hypothetical protein